MIDVQTSSTGVKTICDGQVSTVAANVCRDKYPGAPISWPETSSITGPYYETDRE